jgi:hypothetical protein
MSGGGGMVSFILDADAHTTAGAVDRLHLFAMHRAWAEWRAW